MLAETNLKNVIFAIIDANSPHGASLKEIKSIDAAIKKARKEWERNNTLMILEKYNTWLVKEGYTDTDIMFESDVNEFLNTLKNEK